MHYIELTVNITYPDKLQLVATVRADESGSSSGPDGYHKESQVHYLSELSLSGRVSRYIPETVFSVSLV